MEKNEIISRVEENLHNKYGAGGIDSELVEDCVDSTLEAINYTHSCTQLKVANTDRINKLNDALKNIEEDEDFRLDDGMEWVKQKSFIEGKINALTNL
jgi:hypothetical protein